MIDSLCDQLAKEGMVYVYCRCSKYTAQGHPRVRVTEADMDAQVLALFDRIKIRDEKVGDWFLRVLRARTREGQVQGEQQIAELNRQLAVQRNQYDRLLNLRLLDEIDLRLDGVTLVPAIRKPFDVLAEGLLVSSNRGDKI